MLQQFNISGAASYEHMNDPGFIPREEVQGPLLDVSAGSVLHDITDDMWS
jgi:hypothetical protein